jgi:hypothetical protein
VGEDVELVTVPGERIGAVVADVGIVEQILLRTALHARTAMPAGGRLLIQRAGETVEAADRLAQLRLEPGPYDVISVRFMSLLTSLGAEWIDFSITSTPSRS